MKFDWPESAIETLRQCCAQKMTYGQIGKLLGVGKNAAISKAKRLGLSNGNLPCGEGLTRNGSLGRPRKIRPVMIVVPAPEPPDMSMAINLLDTSAYDRRCRYPLWDEITDEASLTICGHKVEGETTNYCPFHDMLTHGDGRISERRVASVENDSPLPEPVADIAEEAQLSLI